MTLFDTDTRALRVKRRLKRLWPGWRPECCPFCFAPRDADCRLTCPMRRCGQCGGTQQVLDIGNKLGFDEDGNPVFAGKPCPVCTPRVN